MAAQLQTSSGTPQTGYKGIISRIYIDEDCNVAYWEELGNQASVKTQNDEDSLSKLSKYKPNGNTGERPSEDMPGVEISASDPLRATKVALGVWINPITGQIYICR